MRPFTVNGEVWRVVRVSPSDPRLIDRTGNFRLATTNPRTRTVCIADCVEPPLLDKVMLHEVAHAVTISYGLLEPLRRMLPRDERIFVEEWAAQLVEKHALEAAEAASEALNRPICIRGVCNA